MYNYIVFDNKKIHYRDEGSGSVLVLLHGFLENLNIWCDFQLSLSNKMRVISIDLPGHGETEQLGKVHSMQLMADVVKHVLNHCGVDKCVLCGHSMGGYVSMQYAKSYPETLQGLCLFHSHAQSDSDEQKLNRDRVIEIIEQNHHRFVHTFIPDLFAKNNKDIFEEKIIELQQDAKKITAESIIAAAKGMKDRASSLACLAELECPILFIIGKQDPRTPLNKMLVQIAMPKQSESLIMDDCGHMGYIEKQEETLNSLLHFSKRCFTLYV